jgi:hypothetical protein
MPTGSVRGIDVDLNPNTLPSSDQETSPQASTFSSLPNVLRARIWKEICLLSRNIDIWPMSETIALGEKSLFFRYISHTPVPAVLHTSREARSIALKFYRLRFGFEYHLSHGIKLIVPNRIFINAWADRLVWLQTDTFQARPTPRFSYAACTPILMAKYLRRIALPLLDYQFDDTLLENPELEEILLYWIPFTHGQYPCRRYLSIDSDSLVDAQTRLGVSLDPASRGERTTQKGFDKMVPNWQMLKKMIEKKEENERLKDQCVELALKADAPIPGSLKEHVVGGWKRPMVKMGRLVLEPKRRGHPYEM